MNTMLQRSCVCLFVAVAYLSPGSSYGRSNDNHDRKVKIINETSYDLISFYASNISVEDWQEDILGLDVLESGKSIIINIDDGTGYCLYDFKFVFDGGDEIRRERMNVCELSIHRLTD